MGDANPVLAGASIKVRLAGASFNLKSEKLSAMSITIEQLVGQIHDSPTKIILAASGGGTHAISALAEVAGASRTLIEAVVPYSSESMADWLGGRPDQFCSASTSRRMAMAGLFRAEQLSGSPQNVAGVACTAGLTTDRPKRGSHRAHVAAQTIEQTVSWSLILEKGLRDRKGEEELVARMVLNAVAEACGVDGHLRIDLSQTGKHRNDTHRIAPALARIAGRKNRLALPSPLRKSRGRQSKISASPSRPWADAGRRRKPFSPALSTPCISATRRWPRLPKSCLAVRWIWKSQSSIPTNRLSTMRPFIAASSNSRASLPFG